MKIKRTIPITEDRNAVLTDCLGFIESELSHEKKLKRDLPQTLLLAEELIVSLLDASFDDTARKEGEEREFHISIIRKWWDVTVKITAPGREMQLNLTDAGDDEQSIRASLLDAYQDKLQIKNEEGINKVYLAVGVRSQTFAMKCFLATVLGVLICLLLNSCLPADVFDAFCDRYITPISEIMINMFNVLLLPVVFFSIISVTSKISGARDLKNGIGTSTLISSAITSVAASVVGILAFRLLDPGTAEYAYLFKDEITVNTTGSMDFIDVLYSIVPKNVFAPFLENNTMQVIFLALIFGICINLVGQSKALVDVADTLFSLCGKAVEGMGKIIPFGIFCTSISITSTYGANAFLMILPVLLTILISFAVMFVFYLLIIWGYCKLNPIVFLKKAFPMIGDLLKYGSSNDALPYTMRFCRTKLGVPSRVYTFVLPFGCQFNLDGSCIYMAVAGLYLAKFCGITMYGNNTIAMIFSIIILSVGAPNLTGSNIVCLATLLVSIGIPIRVIGLVICLDPIVSLGIAVLNTLSDIVLSVQIAEKYGTLNKDIYYRK